MEAHQSFLSANKKPNYYWRGVRTFAEPPELHEAISRGVSLRCTTERGPAQLVTALKICNHFPLID